jgi:hypothetical protein
MIAMNNYCLSMASAETTQIFIDFEGNEKLPPTFLGVLERTANQEIFRQFIFEDVFSVLTPSAQHPQLRLTTLVNVLQEIADRHGHRVPIYAWSQHEQDVIDELLKGTKIAESWAGRITDAKKLAKPWARKFHPNHKFEKTKRRGTHTLDQYLAIVGYKVPSVHAAGKTGSRLTALRAALESGRTPASWPPSLKKYWTNLLSHNRHDCYGMMALIDQIHLDSSADSGISIIA